MPNLTKGTAPVIPDGGFSLQEKEEAKFVNNTGTISIRTQPVDSVATYLGTLVVVTPKSAGTLASAINGVTRKVTVTTPDLTGTGTATLELLDSAGGTIMSLAAQDESTVTSYGTVEPITTNMSWVATCDGTQGANGTITIAVHYDK